MREPQLGDTVQCKGRTLGRISTVTEFESITVIGVMYVGAVRLEWYPMRQLEWDRDHSVWVVKG